MVKRKSSRPAIISLITDFGGEGEYVGAMKGVILKSNPDVQIIDITHRISPQNILQAAFVLMNTYPYFPSGTVHLVVVDPGVGTKRRPMVLKKKGHLFVGPDNGVFSFVLGAPGKAEAVEITAERYFLSPVSSTFHGRDLFAPAAAHLAAGKGLKEFGPGFEDFVTVGWPQPERKRKSLRGKVLWADGFGNLITNICRKESGSLLEKRPILIKGRGWTIQRLSRTYGEAGPGEPTALFGSSGLLEIAVNGESAQERLGIRAGGMIEIILREKDAGISPGNAEEVQAKNKN